MTDLEEQIRQQELTIANLRCENAKLARRADNLQRMHDTAQRHIGRLQVALKRKDKLTAEAVFGNDRG